MLKPCLRHVDALHGRPFDVVAVAKVRWRRRKAVSSAMPLAFGRFPELSFGKSAGMPYASNDDLPPTIKLNFPPHAQDIFRARLTGKRKSVWI
jgi:hypothetical protein